LSTGPSKQHRSIQLAMMTSFVLCTAAVIASLSYKSILLYVAGTCGLLSTLTGTIQFVPQIATTLITRKFGSLSIATLLMQCPGSFVFVYSLMTQPGTNWTSWISFLVCGIFQFLLICMYVVFHFVPTDKVRYERIEEEVVQDSSDPPTAAH
jgi:magnesium-transporting ATPase (P-type)